MTIEHRLLANDPTQSQHGIVHQTVANAAALAAVVTTATDVSQGRVFYQTDTGQRWVAKTVGAGATFELLTQYPTGLRESSGPTNLDIGALPNPSILTRVGTAIVAATFSAGLSLAAGVLTLADVSNTTKGAVPAITAANAVPLSNGGGTAVTWTALSGGGSPVGTSRTISTTAPLAGGGDLSANRTLTVATVSNTSSGVAPQTNGTLGQALLSAAAAGTPTWGTDFGANDLTSSGNLLIGPTSRATTGAIRVAGAQNILVALNTGAANRVVLSFGVTSTDAITLGDTTQGSYRILSSGQQDAYIGTTRITSLGTSAWNIRPDGASDFTIQMTATAMIALNGVTSGSIRNISFFSAAINWNSGNRLLFVTTATAVPVANPAGGSYFYADPTTQALVWITPGGTQAMGTTAIATTVTGAAGSALVGSANCLRWESNKLGLYNSAPVALQTVTGSRGGNAALADLLTKLATLGAIVDGTSA